MRGAGLSKNKSLQLIRLSKSTAYYRNAPRPSQARPEPSRPSNALSDDETHAIQQLLKAHPTKSTAWVYHHHLNQGTYIASPATFARIKRAMEPTKPRPAQTKTRPMPQLEATGPEQVACWDITYLKDTTGRARFALYAIIDLYSRKILDTLVAPRENADLAAKWMNHILTQYPTIATVHADNGTAMTSKAIRKTYARHHVAYSHSRPHVSNDNAFIESWFKTLKYHAACPAGFTSLSHAQAWVAQAVTAYNQTHYHTQMAGFTPNQIHNGTWKKQAQQNHATRLNAYHQHPQRYHHPPKQQTIPPTITLNTTNTPQKQPNWVTTT